MPLSVKKHRKISTSEIEKLSDEVIVQHYKESDNKEILGVLYKRYAHLMLGVCMKYLKDEERARDAVMQLFSELFLKLKKHHIENFKSWLYTATKNHCLMMLRKDGRDRKVMDELTINIADFMENDAELHHNKELTEKKLLTYMDSLKEEQKWCIKLMYFEDKSYKEISDITGYNIKKVKSYIQNGKRNLKLFFEKDEREV